MKDESYISQKPKFILDQTTQILKKIVKIMESFNHPSLNYLDSAKIPILQLIVEVSNTFESESPLTA